ncbi:MAG: DUF4143 domain-containing protein [Candidatus Firestonebacteria bacterium]
MVYNIGDLRSFNTFIGLLAGRVAQMLNMTALASLVGVSVNTIKSWISVLEASNIVFLLQPFHVNSSKRIIRTPKLFFYDNGLAARLNGITTRQEIINSPLLGPLFENYIISETLKYYSNRGKPVRLNFFRSHSGMEIDLLIEEKSRITPVEIKASASFGNFKDFNYKLLTEYTGRDIGEGFLVYLGGEKLKLSRNITALSSFEYLS